MPDRPSVLIVACGALVSELQAIVSTNALDNVTVECLPVALHNRPELISDEVARRIERADGFDQILIGYADCGTSGDLDKLIKEQTDRGRTIERLPGAHCYEFFATSPMFAEMHDTEPGTFYLTDYLARHFDRLVVKWLGLDRYPQLRDAYFGNYTRLVYLAQTSDRKEKDAARRAADRLGLRYEEVVVGFGELEPAVLDFSMKQAG